MSVSGFKMDGPRLSNRIKLKRQHAVIHLNQIENENVPSPSLPQKLSKEERKKLANQRYRQKLYFQLNVSENRYGAAPPSTDPPSPPQQPDPLPALLLSMVGI